MLQLHILIDLISCICKKRNTVYHPSCTVADRYVSTKPVIKILINDGNIKAIFFSAFIGIQTLECVKEFCYHSNMTRKESGAEASSSTRLNSRCKRFRDSSQLLTIRSLPLLRKRLNLCYLCEDCNAV